MTIDARTQALSNPFVPDTNTNALASTFPTTSVSSDSFTPHTYSEMDALPGSDSTGSSTATLTPSGVTTIPPAANGTTTISNETTNALIQILNDETNYVPNILSSLRNPTYHFRLFMTTEHELLLNTQQTTSTTSADASNESDALQSLYETLDGLPKATIAESGVTAGFCITDVEFTHACGPGWRNRNAMLTDMKITITEPLGTSLLEAMMDASMALGVNNFTKMWYYLELTFLAYNDDGSVNTSPIGALNLPNGGRWVYQINITKNSVHMSESGCVYTLDCKFTGLTGFEDNTNGKTPDNITCSGTTIQEYLNNFATSLNKKWSDRYLGPIVTFNFNVMPIQDDSRNPATFKLQKTDFDSQRNMSLDANGNTFTSQISAQTSIIDVVTFLYAYCEDAQKMMLDTDNASGLEDTSSDDSSTTGPTATYNNKEYRVPIVPLIECDAKITGYDPITGQYMKQITYTIWSYRSFSVNLSTSQYQNIKANPAVTGVIANELLKRGYLRKRYDYQFTGQNTEVLKCDLDYNYYFAAVLPKISGWRQDFLSTSTQKKYNPALANNGALSKQPNEISANATSTGSTTSSIQNQTTQPQQLTAAQLQNRLVGFQGKIDNLTALTSDTTANDPTTGQPMTAQARAGYETLLQSYITARDGLDQQAADLRTQYNKASTDARDALEAKGASNVFAEDAINGSIPLQMTYVQAHSSIDDGSGSTGQWHRGASLVGSIFNQLYSPVSSAMLKIELEVRGDPYWIGYSYLERRATMSGQLPVTSDTALPNFAEGDSTLALRFLFPSSIDPNTGVPVIRASDAFNGMYRVLQVKNSFNQGEFKQTLTAQRLELLTFIPTSQVNKSANTTNTDDDDTSPTDSIFGT